MKIRGKGLKLLRIMKLSTALLLVSTLQIFAIGGYSQNTRLTLDLGETSVGQVLSEIEDQSEFYFLFNQKLIDTERKVLISDKDQSVKEVLDHMFNGTDIEYAVFDRQIVLSPSEYLADLPSRQEPFTVTGTVLDEQGLPMIGVSISVKGTTHGTITDANGVYSIEVPSEAAVLIFSFIGYTVQEVEVGNRTEINLAMSLDVTELDELVVIGYGTVKKSDLTGAISSVSADDLEKANSTSFSDAIQGRASGVTVTQSQGAPGSSSVIRIRGIGTVNNNEPLYVVDGVFFDDYNIINPADVESIEVLKDASAQAIYGSRAANGVILITTKKGKEGRNDFHFNASWGFANPLNIAENLDRDEYYDYALTAYTNGTLREYPFLDTDTFNILTTQAPAGNLARRLKEQYDLGYDTDWQREILQQNALEQKYDLSYVGGNAKSKYALSAGYLDQKGVVRHSGYKRYTARINTEFTPNDIFTFGENLGVYYGSTDIVSPLAGSYVISSLTNAFYRDPLGPVINPDADPDDPNYEYNKYADSDITTIANPVAEIERADNNLKRYSLVGNAFMQARIIEGLNFRTSIGINMDFNQQNIFEAKYYIGNYDSDETGAMTTDFNNTLRWLWENTLSYSKVFDQHSISAVIGYTSEYNTFSILSGNKTHVTTNHELFRVLDGVTDANSIVTVSGTKGESTMASMLARFNYVYGERYLITASVRRDGTSKFGPGYKYGVFPSFSLGWRISNESFFQNVNERFISNFKFRAGWGQIGNQSIRDYAYLSLISLDNVYKYPLGYSPSLNTGSNLISVGTPDIQWETTVQSNLGIDLGFLNNALTFTFDLYDRRTNDMLLNITLPDYVGYTSNPVQNVGSVRNKGFEVELGYKHRVGDFAFDIKGNLTRNVNEVTDLNSGILVSGINRTVEGSSIARFYGYQSDGIFQNEEEIEAHNVDGVLLQPDALPGDVRFKNINGDTVINDLDQTWLGSPLPVFTYGFNVDLEYKNFYLSMFFQGSYGNKIYDVTQASGLNGGGNAARHIYEDAWRGENTSNTVPIITSVDLNKNLRTSDLLMQDASYMRLKTIQLGYDLPASIASKIAAKNLRIWLGGTNLFTVTSYKGVDPEDGNSLGASAISRGVVHTSYPKPRYVNIGVNMTF